MGICQTQEKEVTDVLTFYICAYTAWPAPVLKFPELVTSCVSEYINSETRYFLTAFLYCITAVPIPAVQVSPPPVNRFSSDPPP